MKTSKTDVLIIGGGHAGTTIGSLLAKRGWKVTLVEKDHHARFQIGESLLPMNLPILERLVEVMGDRSHRVECVDYDGQTHRFKARFLVEAGQ
jgi:2-polyprenyl-6-methoxyphenol hydroxylase-like FAD-dependent oxidoreductase